MVDVCADTAANDGWKLVGSSGEGEIDFADLFYICEADKPIDGIDASGKCSDIVELNLSKWNSRLREAGIEASAGSLVEECLVGTPKDLIFGEGGLGELIIDLAAGEFVSLERLSRLSGADVKRTIEAFLPLGVFCDEAKGGLRSLLATARGDSIPMRRLYALSLCRFPCSSRLSWNVDESVVETALGGALAAYEEDVRVLARSVESCVAACRRPVVLLKSPDGAPYEEVSSLISSFIGLDEVRIDASGVSSALELVGNTSAYSNALPGRIVQGRCLAEGDALVSIFNAESLTRLKKEDGDAVAFLRALMKGAVDDAFLGLPVSMRVSPVLVVQEVGSRSEFESAANIVVSLHALNEGEKAAEAVRLASARGYELLPDAAEHLVASHCFDSGTSMVRSCVEAICDHCEYRGGAPDGIVDVGTVRQALPEPDDSDPRRLFALKRRALAEQGEIEVGVARSLLSDALGGDIEAKGKLAMFLSAVPDGSCLPHLSARDVAAAIEETHPHMPGADGLSAAISTSLRSSRPAPILLHGPAGVGKTTLCESLARRLGVAFVKYDVPGLGLSEIFGSHSRPSNLIEAVSKTGGRPGIILLDEADKPAAVGSGSLLSLLDHGKVMDSYFGATIDISRWLVVLAANDPDEVSGYVRDRCSVVEVPGYAPSRKALVAERLVEAEARSLGLDVAAIHAEDDAIRYLSNVDDEAGLRSFQKRIRRMLGLCDGRFDLDDALTLYSRESRRCPEGSTVVIMNRAGYKGGAAAAAVGTVRAKDSDGVSSIAGTPAFETCLRTAMVSLAATTGMVPSRVCAFLAGLDDVEHACCADAELGIGVQLALASAGLPALAKTAFYGRLSPTGAVLEPDRDELVKSPFVVARAAAWGCETIVASKAFCKDRSARKEAETLGVELVAADCLSSAIGYAKNMSSLKEFLKTA